MGGHGIAPIHLARLYPVVKYLQVNSVPSPVPVRLCECCGSLKSGRQRTANRLGRREDVYGSGTNKNVGESWLSLVLEPVASTLDHHETPG
jgi:hypothetical protein